jgi:hypothetical protein
MQRWTEPHDSPRKFRSKKFASYLARAEAHLLDARVKEKFVFLGTASEMKAGERQY